MTVQNPCMTPLYYYFSLIRTPSPFLTRVRLMSLMFISSPYGNGQWIFSKTRYWLRTGFGMPKGSRSSMVQSLCECFMSLGLPMHFGKLRYVLVCLIWFLFLLSLVKYPFRCQTTMLYPVCGQDQAIIVWYAERISSICTVCKSSGWNSQQWRCRRWSSCWMAAYRKSAFNY